MSANDEPDDTCGVHESGPGTHQLRARYREIVGSVVGWWGTLLVVWYVGTRKGWGDIHRGLSDASHGRGGATHHAGGAERRIIWERRATRHTGRVGEGRDDVSAGYEPKSRTGGGSRWTEGRGME